MHLGYSPRHTAPIVTPEGYWIDMSDYREQSNLAKAKRAGIIEQKPVGHKSTKPKPRPFVLECLSRYRSATGEWRKWKAYRSREEAEMVQQQMTRKLSSWGWRVVEDE